MPFGAGPRACLGQGLAQDAMKAALAAWLTRFRFELAADDPEGVEGGGRGGHGRAEPYRQTADLCLSMAGGLPLIVSRRS